MEYMAAKKRPAAATLTRHMADPDPNKANKLVDLGGDGPKKKTTTGQMAAVRTTSGGGIPAHVPAKAKPVATPVSGVRQQTAFQKSQLKSAFQNSGDAENKARLAHSLGNSGTTRSPLYEDDDEPTALGAKYDGETPAPELTGKDLWKAVQAPIQSREGRRSRETYRMVINQFAVGKNPRYAPDAPDKPRAHIFVWDVSRAMNCEIPHFVGPKELSLAQTVDWLRHEGPMRGWLRVTIENAKAEALEGKLVVAVPKDTRVSQLAVVLPEEETSSDGKPYVAAAGKARGNKLKLGDALGVFAAECFVHP
jgi:hypothetical protein